MNCLDEDTLLEFLAGKLDAAQTAAARRHLAACTICNAIATDLIQDAVAIHDRVGSRGKRAVGASRDDAQAPSYELAHGSIVGGRYQLECSLGEGGMGAVWRARDNTSGSFVAIKFLKAFDSAAQKRFLREIAVSRALRHPELIRVLDVLPDVEAGCPALVLELLEGESLADRLARARRLPLRESLEIARGVARAVAFVHASGIIHRDLKPANVFLSDTPPPSVKVLDLGLARIVDDTLVSASTRLTRTGHAVGSPAYMAPEQLAGERDVDARADVWSLGIILYECLTGRRPFEGVTVADLIRQTAREPVPPFEAFDSGANIPSEVFTLVSAMLASKRQNRIGSLQMVVTAISALTTELRTSVQTPALSAIPDLPRQKQ